jgi:hypothetical protein
MWRGILCVLNLWRDEDGHGSIACRVPSPNGPPFWKTSPIKWWKSRAKDQGGIWTNHSETFSCSLPRILCSSTRMLFISGGVDFHPKGLLFYGRARLTCRLPSNWRHVRLPLNRRLRSRTSRNFWAAFGSEKPTKLKCPPSVFDRSGSDYFLQAHLDEFETYQMLYIGLSLARSLLLKLFAFYSDKPWRQRSPRPVCNKHVLNISVIRLMINSNLHISSSIDLELVAYAIQNVEKKNAGRAAFSVNVV